MLKHFFLLLFAIIVLASCGGNDDPGNPVEPFVPIAKIDRRISEYTSLHRVVVTTTLVIR